MFPTITRSERTSTPEHTKQATIMSDIIRTSRLLSLPGKLRKRIYEFALTSDHGLEYESASSGVSSLCEGYADAQPAKAAALVASHLLNKDAAIVVFRETGTAEQFNELRHTCKRLAAEMTDLELQYNTLTVTCSGYHECYPNLNQRYRTTDGELKYVMRTTVLQRIHELGTSPFRQLRNVVVKTKARDYTPTYGGKDGLHLPLCLRQGSPDSIPDFVEFCIAQPRINMRYFGPCVAYDTVIQEEVRLAQVVANGVAFARVVRGKDLSYFMPHRHRQWVRDVMGEFEVVEQFADKFRGQISRAHLRPAID
jgi:hypothetical protein